VVVALKAMIEALGTLGLNLYFGGVAVLNRRLCIIGPHRPCGSSARGRRIILLLSKSPMTSSPSIVSIVLSFLFLSSRLNFFRSNVCKCASARADMDVITSAERFNLEGIFERLLPIVMSAPIVV